MAINAQTVELIEVLRQEHHAMQEQMEKIQSVLNEYTSSYGANSLDELACELRQLRLSMEVHHHKEANNLFPLLQVRLGQKDWRIGMIEVEDRLLIDRMNRLMADLTKPLHSLSVVQFRKELDLIEKDMIDHGKKEEEFLFSFLLKSEGVGSALPYDPRAGVQGLILKVNLWARFKAKLQSLWKR
jgi:iron-sulfur cluster repair protein YtfE (RIC family)